MAADPTLYLIFALFSGLLGTAFSVLIRLELSSPGSQFITDNQLYNSIITAHAVLMIFFMVEKSFNMLNMKPQLSLYANMVIEDNPGPALLSKQPEAEIKAVSQSERLLIFQIIPGMNNRKIFNWYHLKTLNPTSNPFFKKTRINLLHQFSEHTRTFSTTSSVFEARYPKDRYSTNYTVLPVEAHRAYKNVDLDKLLIIKENNAKAGVYRFLNLTNGKSYIGSSSNLGRRLKQYFSIYRLERELKRGRSRINSALLKWGYSNFSLEILEYCDPDKAVSREQYYLDLLKPEYNILTKAGSLLGHQHSEETKFKISLQWTEDRKAKFLEYLNLHNSSKEQEEHLKRLHLSRKGCPRPEGAGVPSVPIEVLDTKNNETTIYISICEAARAIGVSQAAISKAFKKQGESTILIKKQYKITKLSSN